LRRGKQSIHKTIEFLQVFKAATCGLWQTYRGREIPACTHGFFLLDRLWKAATPGRGSKLAAGGGAQAPRQEMSHTKDFSSICQHIFGWGTSSCWSCHDGQMSIVSKPYLMRRTMHTVIKASNVMIGTD
jgi:hypothetical protein